MHLIIDSNDDDSCYFHGLHRLEQWRTNNLKRRRMYTRLLEADVSMHLCMYLCRRRLLLNSVEIHFICIV